MNKGRKRTSLIVLSIITLISVALVGCTTDGDSGNGETIIFADAGWDSMRLHNEIAGFIVEHGFGYKTDVLPGSTAATFAGFRNGDIDIYMETWTENLIDVYDEAIEAGDIEEVSINFDDNAQGFYIPTVMVEGDPARGIEPVAPDLKTVEDLKKYWELFKDPEEPSKGRIYGSPPGWEADKIMQAKYETYGLDEYFTYFSPGSDTALSTSLAAAGEKDEPWVGYYWEPTWILGKYNMTLLEEEPYNEEIWNENYGTTFPPMPVTVCVYKDFKEKAPDVYSFLENYKTSSQITNEALAYMQEHDTDTDEAAKWFFEEYEELWTSWLSEDVVEKVKSALN